MHKRATTLSERLKTLSIQPGWSQVKIADLLGVSRGTVNRWINQNITPHPYYKRRLADLLQVPLEQLQAPSLPETEQYETTRRFVFDTAIPPIPSIMLGHADDQKVLRAALTTSTTTGAPRISVLYGLPGIGKTTLATTLAYDEQIQQYFGGIFWARLGQSPDIIQKLSHWARTLGITERRLEKLATIEEWASLLRQVLSQESRYLFILDDVWDMESAMALQIGAPNCTYVITTRIPSVAARLTEQEDIYQIEELTEQESLHLVEYFSPEVVQEEHLPVLKELIQAVGNLPLALTLIGHSLRRHGYIGHARRINATLQQLLSDLHERLALRPASSILSSDQASASLSLRSVIALSAQQLSPEAHQALCALSILPAKPGTFSEEVACAIADCSVDFLDELTDAGLLELESSNDYTIHQTIADYARSHLTPEMKKDVVSRLRSTVLAFVQTHTTDYPRLYREQGAILTALAAIEEQQRYQDLYTMFFYFAPFLLAQSRYAQCEQMCSTLKHLAALHQDPQGTTLALLYQGVLARKKQNFVLAEELLLRGITLAKTHQFQDLLLELSIALCAVSLRKGNPHVAIEYALEGMAFARQTQDLVRLCHLMHAYGQTLALVGRTEDIQRTLEEGLALARQLDHKELMCKFYIDLAVLLLIQFRFEESVSALEQGLVCARAIDHREYQCACLTNMAAVMLRTQAPEKSIPILQEAEELALRLQHLEHLTIIWLKRAEIAIFQNQTEKAFEYHEKAMLLNQSNGNTYSLAMCVSDRTELFLITGQVEEAIAAALQGLRLMDELQENSTRRAAFLFSLGTAYYMRDQPGDRDQATDYYLRAVDLFEYSNEASMIEICWCALSNLAARQGDWQEAQRYADRISSPIETFLKNAEIAHLKIFWGAQFLDIRIRLAVYHNKSEQAQSLIEMALGYLRAHQNKLHQDSEKLLHQYEHWQALLKEGKRINLQGGAKQSS